MDKTDVIRANGFAAEYARVMRGKQITTICVICVNQWLIRVFSHRLTLITLISVMVNLTMNIRAINAHT